MFLCTHFVGLNPFEVKKRDYREVLELYVQTIISLYNQNKKENTGTWVSSKNATWY